MTRPRFKLIVCDLDGTLLAADATLSAEALQLIAGAKERGIELIAATGRRRFSALKILQPAGFGRVAIVQNGAVTIDVATGATQRARLLDPEVIRELTGFLGKRGVAPLVYTDQNEGPGELFHEQNPVDPTGFLRGYLAYVTGHATAVAQLSECWIERGVRVVTHHNRAVLQALQQEVDAGFARVVRTFLGFDQTHGVHRMEILHRDATKWARILEVASGLKIAPDEILAAGDDSNDCEMLAGAGHSIAAPGANLEARSAAKEVLESGGVDAVIRTLKKHLH